MNKKLIFIFSAISLLILFVIFSYIVQKKLFLHIDFDTTVRLQNHIPRIFDGLFSVFSLIGSFEVVSIILLGLLFIWRKKSIFFVYPLFVGMHLFEVFGKVFVNHPSPPKMLIRTIYPYLFPSGAAQLSSSYPSGHSARALFITVIAIFIIFHTRKLSPSKKMLLLGVCLVYDAVMLTSRVYLGEHWLSDVIGGSILGFAFGALGFMFL